MPDDASAEHGAMVALEHAEVLARCAGCRTRQREVLVLRYYVDLSEADIADAIGISRGAVKSHASRGMAALRTDPGGRPHEHPRSTTLTDDPLAARLRDALTSEAAMVSPSDDGLQQIRAGIDQHDQAAVVAAPGHTGAGRRPGARRDGRRHRRVRRRQRRRRQRRRRPSRPRVADRVGVGAARAVRPAGHVEHADHPLAVEGDVYVYYAMDDGQAPAALPRAAPEPAAWTGGHGGADARCSPSRPVDPDYYVPVAGEHQARSATSVAGDTATVDLVVRRRSARRPRRRPCRSSSTP